MQPLQRTEFPGFLSEARLAAQSRFAIRQLIPSDEPEMSRLLIRLDLQARLDRFGYDIGDGALQTHARASLTTLPAVFGALVDGRLSGVAEITHIAADDSAMFAFAVDAEWRRQGIGCRLLLAALAWADDQGMISVRLQCTRTNWAVRQIARKANARINLAAGKFLAEFDARPAAAFAQTMPT
jgi:GNAT superfamily N-acetyltransferase